MAGHWKSYFINSLCWHSRFEHIETEYIAPIRSWASINGRVDFERAKPHAAFPPLSSLVSVNIRPATANCFSAVQPDSFICVREPVVLPKELPCATGSYIQFSLDGEEEWDLMPIENTSDTVAAAKAVGFNNSTQRMILILCERFEWVNVYFVVMGLILKVLPGDEKGRFHRIGFFSHNIDLPWSGEVDPLAVLKKDYLMRISEKEVRIFRWGLNYISVVRGGERTGKKGQINMQWLWNLAMAHLELRASLGTHLQSRRQA